MAAKSDGTRRRGPGRPWPKGVSGNPKGRPRDGESWAGVIRWAANLTGTEAARIAPDEMRKFLAPLAGLTLKQGIVLRIITALLFEPGAAMFTAFVDRAEGKVPTVIRTWRDDLIELIKDGTLPFAAVEEEFGRDLALELFAGAGVLLGEGGEVAEDGAGED